MIDRCKAFLPLIKDANENLPKMKSEDIDIECCNADMPYISMDLALGVYDVLEPKRATNEVTVKDFLGLKEEEKITLDKSIDSEVNFLDILYETDAA